MKFSGSLTGGTRPIEVQAITSPQTSPMYHEERTKAGTEDRCLNLGEEQPLGLFVAQGDVVIQQVGKKCHCGITRHT